ncbi:LppM family (lipo)protein [Paeniglutamicibacter sp. MACA_103]|uniref:LppM family (lipo)protein n=1 Tax=Paeniglutamicibacter sp. MACA_103 TaxID=3377337 RepID=UPI0038954BE2
MKKIVSVIGVMVALALSLTGCLKMDVDLVVSSPEQATMEMVVAVDKNVVGDATVEELLGYMGITEEQLVQRLPADMLKAPYDEGNFKGYTFTLEDKPLSEISDFSQKLGPKIDLEYRDEMYHFSAQGLAGTDTSTLSESTMTVTFPGKVTTASPGAHIDGKTVTFDMRESSGEITAVAKPHDNMPMYLSLGFGVLALLGAVIAVATMRRTEETENVHA